MRAYLARVVLLFMAKAIPIKKECLTITKDIAGKSLNGSTVFD